MEADTLHIALKLRALPIPCSQHSTNKLDDIRACFVSRYLALLRLGGTPLFNKSRIHQSPLDSDFLFQKGLQFCRIFAAGGLQLALYPLQLAA